MIIPAVIAKDFEELQSKLAKIDGLVSWAQIDVMDGVFVPPITWRDPADLENISTAINLEAHLMIANTENIIDKWINSPVKRILLHHESTTHAQIEKLIEKIQKSGKEAGIALKLQTPLFVLNSLIQNSKFKIRVIQLMSISEIGYHGHPFEEKVLERIKTLREKYPDITISVDGGVSLENAPKILSAGADNLLVGSTIFKSDDIGETIKKFRDIDYG